MNLYENNINANDIYGDKVELSSYRGKVLLIVNTASKCGFTPQFKGLEMLYEKYNEKGLEILGFPSNQFKEEPGNSEEIVNFCQLNYGVSFPMFEKIEVNGENRHELYKFLIENSPKRTGKNVKWNFEKFLVDREGNIVDRFLSVKTPEGIEKHIRSLL